MRKIKKLLSFITATFVAMSLALSSGVASALSEQQIKNELNKLVVRYSDGSSELLNKHEGWLDLLAAVLRYAEATEADHVSDSLPKGYPDCRHRVPIRW